MTGLTAFGAEDAGRLAALHATAFDQPWDATAFVDLLASPGVGALGVETDEGPVGLVLLRAIAGEAEILTLAVVPAARRRGVGRVLVEAAAGTAAGLGAEVLWLEVAADNAAALALYGAAGFDIAGRRRAYYSRTDAPAQDAVVMRRALNTKSR
jgi:ribosomal-protein-alanine N-acetyltransferase